MNRFNKKGQGATEYVVILAIIVVIAVTLLNGPFSSALKSQVSNIASMIGGAGGGSGS
jgi:Flp pilus assembly pilin Flp